MRKIIIFILLIALVLSLSSCGITKLVKSDKLTIVTTIFPAYDFALHVGGEKVEVVQLLPAGMESHTYEPTAKDIIFLSEADLFIYNGGESDAWVDIILDSLESPIRSIKMMDQVELKFEFGHDHEYDEHVWTSLRNTITIIESIKNALVEIDEENKDYYESMANSYIESISSLDQEFVDFFESYNEPLIFADKFPFLYMSEDYGFEYLAAFPGCGHETEPDARTIANIIDTVKMLSIPYIFHIEMSNLSIANGISDSTGAKMALFHSAHNVSNAEKKNQVTYLSIMENNLITLKEVLNGSLD